MEQLAYDKAYETLKLVGGEAGVQVIADLEKSAPDLKRFIIEFVFGNVLTRPELDLKTREIATVGALTALGNAAPQLRLHIHGMLNVGWTRRDVVEIILQMVVYAGFPAAMNGIAAAKEVFQERDAMGLN
jgi:4-carboxymuconolactone decarboxylase